MTGMKGRKKRFWSDEEKRSICEQTRVPGVSVAQVARRYALNSKLFFKWLRYPRFSAVSDDSAESVDPCSGFLPVEISGQEVDGTEGTVASTLSPASVTSVVARWIDITLSDGRRIVVEGPTGLLAVVDLIRALAPA